MPIRRSEAYDDPLRKTSKIVEKPEKIALPHKITEKNVSLEESQIEWSNLIFLPFHPVFQLFVLFSVFIKAMLGPIQSVYPIVYCSDVMDHHPVLIFIKYSYWYFCDSFYGIDTFLHIVHRQVTDKAMRREHLPKSALLLMLDLLSLVPFFRLVMTDPCPVPRLWPNILAFNEFLVIYRVTQYFSLVTTHSYWMLIMGYTIVLCMCLNCVACFWLLLTEEGFCERCHGTDNFYDWRAFVAYKLNETDIGYTTYVYAFTFVFSFTETSFFNEEVQPSAILEFIIVCIFLVAKYILNHFIIMPKAFAESILRLRRVSQKYPLVKKIVDETRRRNISAGAATKVQDIYNMLWRKRSGIIAMPEIFSAEIPRYLRLEIKQDLLWPLYFHSPTLRRTSYPLRRWLSESVIITYKLPGEKFFIGSHSTSTLYYLKSGVVQIISADDGTTPILSVTSGTIFGDINFYVPQLKRKVSVRCLTYCEVYYVQRKNIIRALHKYPADRKIIMHCVKERILHAKKLFANKAFVRGLDRNEDEGIAWIKRRWWEISETVDFQALKHGLSRDQVRCDITPEESIYHCAKYIGQLVLCTQTELQTKSMFTNFKFPWIINPQSIFGEVWHKIVSIDVILVLCLYPPNLIKPEIPAWFIFFTFISDTIYALDIGVSLFTAVKKQEMVTNTFSSVMFERFKSLSFMLDLLASLWIEEVAKFCGAPEYFYTVQFNRLIKIYVLFHGEYIKWDITQDPLIDVCRQIILLHFAYEVLASHLVFELSCYIVQITHSYFFGDLLCSKTVKENCREVNPIFGVTVLWAFENTFSEYVAQNLTDVYVGIVVTYVAYIVFIYTKARYVSYLYLKTRIITNYQRFVLSLKKYYEHYSIHHDLLKRLDRYLVCHWKYYRGTDVLFPNTLENEPLEVYWKAQGEVAQRIIGESRPFEHADPALIRELACAGKYLLLPKSANILMFGIACKNVTWVVQGFVKSEYHNEKGELLSTYYASGSMLSSSAVYFCKASLRSYTAYTDCEILYVQKQEFFEIYQRYPVEYEYLQNCIQEFGASFNDIFKKNILKHRDYQTKLRDRIYSTRMSMVSTSKVIPDIQESRSLPFEGHFWGDPESGFMQSWLMFRSAVVFVSITSASVLGGVGAVSRWIFTMISAFCDCIAWIDIVIKLFLAYHDERGIMITNSWKCLANYLTKAFVLDLIGAIPLFDIIRATMTEDIDADYAFLINTIIKWQIVNMLIVLGSSHYFMVKCVKFDFNEKTMQLLHVSVRKACWMPDVIPLPQNLTWDELHLIFAESLSLAESGMMALNFGRFNVDRENLGVGICLFILGIVFWFITCYALVLLVLNARGDTLFQHSVSQLSRFLLSERVEKPVIEKVMSHFRYCWIRTKGINIEQLSNDRIGVVFRQDLNYYFYKKTFTLLDSIIKGGEPMQRQLASVCTQAFFLEGHDIFRERDVNTHLCVVHRGKVVITKEGQKIIVLTKGDIFGQLVGTTPRPIRVTATAEDKVDLLYIEIKAFQNIITDGIRKQISRNPQHKNDFMATKNVFVESPYDTVQYLLRGRKTIQFPWMSQPIEGRHGTWYSYFLHLTWYLSPMMSACCVSLFITLPQVSVSWFRLYVILVIFDIVHIINFISEFYTIELVVIRNKCVAKRVGVQKFKYWFTYVDILTILIPLGTLINNDWRYQIPRMLRLKYFLDFEYHFCRNFKTRLSPIFLKLAIMLLVVHCFTCGWIYVACRDEKFPTAIKDMRGMTTTIDFSQWIHPDDRGGGCARTTRDIIDEEDENFIGPSFVVPRYWQNDYIVALTFILLIQTHTNIDTVIPLSLSQVYYKVVATFIMQLLDIYIMAMAINAGYTKYRELYQYDYAVKNMLIYLTDSGLYKSLSDTVLDYAVQLWKRQKGDKLPELAYQGPPCLRQDLFTALYIHHLEQIPTLCTLPYYFKRQLAARLQRTVVFPGKCIVREGDTFSITYFIHEGEVEKWYNDVSGESKLMSVLYTNGYFGCIAGLFSNMAFQFTYFSRTVVDLVYLSLENWKDLLESYPEVKVMLYETARSMNKDFVKNQWGKLPQNIPSAGEIF